MRPFDYSSSAELFPTRNLRARRTTVGYRRFARAADAIKFAIEELPPELLHGAHMEVNEERFDSGAIRRLYEDAGYPLPRRTPKAAGAATSKVRAPKIAAGAAPKNGRAADGRAAEGSGAAHVKGSSAATSMKSGVVKTPVKNGGAAEAKAPVAPAAKKPAPSRAAEGASAATSKTPAKKARVAVPTD